MFKPGVFFFGVKPPQFSWSVGQPFSHGEVPGDFGGPSHGSQQPAAVRAPRGPPRAGRQEGPGAAAAAAARGVVAWRWSWAVLELGTSQKASETLGQ